MGDVISISRVNDIDIFSEFDSQCPSIPEDIDQRIPRSARKAVTRPGALNDQGVFRKHCAIVVALSLSVLFIVKFVSGAVSSQMDLQYRDFEGDVATHRTSQTAWAEYIETMESDPYYQRVIREKQLYSRQYPQ